MTRSDVFFGIVCLIAVIALSYGIAGEMQRLRELHHAEPVTLDY